MPVPDFTVPFILSSKVFSVTDLLLNQEVAFASGSGVFLLDPDGCDLRTTVRATKKPVPQADGDIFGRYRFTTGCEMDLSVQFWEWNGGSIPDKVACYELLQEMYDSFMGYSYALLNAGDNEGRVIWLPYGDSSPQSDYRMLDDIRLWTYPAEDKTPTAFTLKLTVDCQLPYAEDLTQLSPSIPGPVINYGNRPLYPVWKIYAGAGGYTGFTLTNSSTGDLFTYDGNLPGAVGVPNGSYLEIDTFRNTVYLNGSGANRKPGIVMTTSDFFLIPPGSNTIALTYTGTGGASVALINAAWA